MLGGTSRPSIDTLALRTPELVTVVPSLTDTTRWASGSVNCAGSPLTVIVGGTLSTLTVDLVTPSKIGSQTSASTVSSPSGHEPMESILKMYGSLFTFAPPTSLDGHSCSWHSLHWSPAHASRALNSSRAFQPPGPWRCTRSIPTPGS